MIGISRLREWIYRHRLLRSMELPAFVVSVGNLSLGGTGKSAFVMTLAEWAASKKIPTLILSRGYKRKTKSMRIVAPREVLPDESEIGDEPWMIKQRAPDACLLVHPDRARMAKRHWHQLGHPRLVLLDDGFQHWRCARDIDVVMVDATESVEQKTIPFGRLRETVLALRRADLVLITRARAVPEADLERLRLLLKKSSTPRHKPTWKRNTGTSLRIVAADYDCSGFLDATTGQRVELPSDREYLLVSGIAKPDHLRFVVRRSGVQVVEELYFPDHHRLTEADILQIRAALRRLRNGALLVTEKDWGRWSRLFSDLPGFVICVRFSFLGEGKEEIDTFLEEIARAVACST